MEIRQREMEHIRKYGYRMDGMPGYEKTEMEQNGLAVPDIPESPGVNNAIKRILQCVNIRWTPLKPVPQTTGHQTQGVFAQGIPVRGLPYSSTRIYEKFIGINVSLETFMSAVRNPDSVLYTENLFNTCGNATAFYGTVCSALVGYALDLPYRAQTICWPQIPGMELVNSQCADHVKLGDTLLSRTHVAMITEITRTPDGKTYTISVSEATHPQCITTKYNASTFEEYWFSKMECAVYRYKLIHTVPYQPSPYAPLTGEQAGEAIYNTQLAINYGNKANYKKGEVVVYSIFHTRWHELRVIKGKSIYQTIPLECDQRRIRLAYEDCGEYEAFCVGAHGDRSNPVWFRVVGSEVHTDKDQYRPGEPIEITFSASAPTDNAVCLALMDKTQGTRIVHAFTAEESSLGKAVCTFDCPGIYKMKVTFRNQYGAYISDFITVRINPD